MTDYDRDPEALAWARAKVQEVVDKAEACAANTHLSDETREGWRQTALFIRHELVSRDGAAYAAFDERWPSLVNAVQPATEATQPAKSPLREQIAAAIYEKSNPGYRWADAHPDDVLAYGTDADAALKAIEGHLDIGEAEAWCKTCRRVWDGPRHQCESDAEQRLARVVAALPPYSLPTHGDRSEGVQMGWDLARQAVLDALNPPTTTAPGRTSEAAVEREITP